MHPVGYMKLLKYCLIFNFAFFLTELSLHLLQYMNIKAQLSGSNFGSILLGSFVATDRFYSDHKRAANNRELWSLISGSLIIFFAVIFVSDLADTGSHAEFEAHISNVIDKIGNAYAISETAINILYYTGMTHLGFCFASTIDFRKANTPDASVRL